jgi:hypothetical protein
VDTFFRKPLVELKDYVWKKYEINIAAEAITMTTVQTIVKCFEIYFGKMAHKLPVMALVMGSFFDFSGRNAASVSSRPLE